jgi:hypothetical protein
MSSPESREAFERLYDIEVDTEVTARLLGALGLYNANDGTPGSPEHVESQWQQPETD